MAVNPNMKQFIDSQEIVMVGRAQYIILEWQGEKIGILNIYAPNTVADRIELWSHLISSLPHNIDHWCIGGDFNMLEHPTDRAGGRGDTIRGNELAKWDQLSMILTISDVWNSPEFITHKGSRLYSRADLSHTPVNQSRLDRFYVTDYFRSLGGMVMIVPDTSLSNHVPILLRIDSKEPAHNSPKSRLKIPEKMLLQEQWKDEVFQIWHEVTNLNLEPATRLAEGINQLSTFFYNKAYTLHTEEKTKKQSLRRGIASLQRLIEKDSHNEMLVKELVEAQEKWKISEENKLEFLFHRYAAQWTKKGDLVSKDFFHIAGPKRSPTHIAHLVNKEGDLTSDPNQIRVIATEYYNELLRAPPSNPDKEEASQYVWSSMKKTVNSKVSEILIQSFTSDELLEALKSLPRHSCPGEDGLTPTFFIQYWDLLNLLICQGFQNIFSSGKMPEQISEGLIYLVPKGDSKQTDIRKWRPITVLNTIYKIYAKSLMTRLSTFLPDIIHPSQTRFVPSRSIFDNIFTYWGASAKARILGEDLAVLLLDFEKAYDRVDWTFLQGTMAKMGFPEAWINGTAATYSSAHSRILLSGIKGDKIPLSRSVRQGCPLAPYLFLIFAEAMHCFLTDPHNGLKGISLPLTEQSLLDNEFADDTTIYLQGQEENLTKMFNLLTTFCLASGARVNWNKSKAIWISANQPPNWSPVEGFAWIP